jgi:hypothetical protein
MWAMGTWGPWGHVPKALSLARVMRVNKIIHHSLICKGKPRGYASGSTPRFSDDLDPHVDMSTMSTFPNDLESDMRYDPLTRALLDLAERGERTPCADFSIKHLWLSESPGERRLATKMCAPCQVKAECLQSAIEHDTRFGVFGGHDLTVAPGGKKPAA